MASVVFLERDGLVKFSKQLKEMHRSSLPVVVRQTLNKAAFDMRKTSLPKTYAEDFTVRDKNFLRSRTRVKPAQGFNIRDMEAKMGLYGSDETTKDLAKQTTGGVVGSRAFTPMETARTSDSREKKIRRNARLDRIALKNRVRKRDGQKMIRSAHKAGKGAHLLYGDTMFLIKSVRKRKKTNKTWVNLKPLYSYEKGRKARITDKKTYIQRAANAQGALMYNNFVGFANKKLKR